MLMNWLMGISTAIAEEGAEVAEQAAIGMGDIIMQVVMIGGMIAIFYFMLIRPQRKKDKKVKEMLNALKHGDRVTTIGGIYGTITNIKDDTVTLSVGAQRIEMVFARWAIRNVEEVSIENDGEILA